MTETDTTNPYENVPHMRLLRCLTCNSFDELPDYQGPPEYDTTLSYVVDKHGPNHQGQLYRLPIGFWVQEEYRRRIIEQIRGGSSGLAEFDSSYYDVQNTFRDDAMACYKKHLRPKEGCPDWRHSSKELNPDTKAERKEAGLSLTPTGPKVYICDFCPVRSYYERKARGD